MQKFQALACSTAVVKTRNAKISDFIFYFLDTESAFMFDVKVIFFNFFH